MAINDGANPNDVTAITIAHSFIVIFIDPLEFYLYKNIYFCFYNNKIIFNFSIFVEFFIRKAPFIKYILYWHFA